MRLDRYVSQVTGCSRREVRTLIRCGQITVDGETVTDPGLRIGEGRRVDHLGTALRPPQPTYLMLHKPCGLLSATHDRSQATVMALLPPAVAPRLHLVGRLDKDTSGLLLLTDDGDWSHRLTSPRHACPKTYRADLAEPLVADAERRLARGLMLRNEQRPTRPATLERLDATQVRITVREGRYHLVRRLFAALGNRVLALHRESVGGLVLDPALAPGQWRALSPAEAERALGDGGMD